MEIIAVAIVLKKPCAVRAALEYEWQMLSEFRSMTGKTQSERTQADRQGEYPEQPPHPRPPRSRV